MQQNAGEPGDFLVVCGCGSVLPRLEAWVPFLGRGLDPACHNLDLVRPNKEFKKKKERMQWHFRLDPEQKKDANRAANGIQ